MDIAHIKMKICKPYYSASPNDITQFFGANKQPYQPEGHTGLDFVSVYGTFLVAPEKVKIVNIITPNKLLEDGGEEWRKHAEYGYGVLMESVQEAGLYYLHWHCVPVFPVSIGDIVEQGEEVAQMGNWGFVMTGGVYVPIQIRNDKPHKGTHTHFEMFREFGGKRQYVDPLSYIDWGIPIKNDFLKEVKAILYKMLELLR